MRRSILVLPILILSAFLTSNLFARRPNVILIMADDMGAKELACYGHATHKTPTLDELATTGIQFETAYTACVCHPTRFEIMTGQYGSTNGVCHFAGRQGGPDVDSPEEQIVNHLTFGKVLKSAGFATAMAGKWQLTGEHPTLIHENGFDEYCMWAYKHNLPKGAVHRGYENKSGKHSRYWYPSIVKNGKHVPTTINDYGPDMYTDFVIDFASRHKDEPFFIYYPMALTHGPYFATPMSNPNARDKFRNSKKDHFGENVAYTDTLVGRIVAAIAELGLREDTIIMFTADNGTGGEGKNTPTELGARVPFIVNCPGRVKAQGLSKALIDTSDVMPTLVELCEAKLPAGHPIDGVSFAPILSGATESTREWIYSFVADKRILRTQRYLLEDNSMTDFGRLYDCGESRNGSGYVNVTNSERLEVLEVRKQFMEILKSKPVPASALKVRRKKKRAA